MGVPSVPKSPLLNWYGGKWNIAPWIHGLLPEHDIFIDLFGGSGAMTVTSRAKTRIYNDLDSRLHKVFLALMDPAVVAETERLLGSIPRSEEMTDHILNLWHHDHEKLSTSQTLWAAIYLGATTFSSWGTTHSRAYFSFGKAAHSRWPRGEVVSQWVASWRDVIIMQGDALSLVEKAVKTPETLGGSATKLPKICLYADPPYDYGGQRSATAGSPIYKHDIGDLQKTLIPALLEACKKPHISVALSGYEGSPTIEAFRAGGGSLHIKEVPNRWQSTGEAAETKTEAVVLFPPSDKEDSLMAMFPGE